MARLLEAGDLYFFYAPKRGVERVTGPGDVGEIDIVLSGDQAFGRRCRLLSLAASALPTKTDGAGRAIVHVEAVSNRPEDMEGALSQRRIGEPPTPQHPRSVQRPVGEGRYGLVEHDGETDLVYVLELPASPGPAQQGLGILPCATYRLGRSEVMKTVLNPAEIRAGMDLFLEPEAATVDPAIVSQLNVQRESAGTAEIFAELKLRRLEYPLDALYTGNWV
jgi:hypothetical protein